MQMRKPLTVPRLLVEGAGSCADLFYGSGFLPVDPVVFLDEGKRKNLVVPMLEFGRAQQECPGVDVFLPEQVHVPNDQRRKISAWALAILNFRKIKRVQVSTFFPAGIARELEKHRIAVDIISGTMYPARLIKRRDEIEKITVSQRAAVAAMRAAHHALKASTIGRNGWLMFNGKKLTSEIIREAIDITLLRHGCIARDTIVASAAQAADPHDRGSGPIKAGDTVVVDIFPQHKRSGYWGDITRTFCRGPASPELTRMYRTVLTAQKRALAMIKPGVSGSDIHAMITNYFIEQGYPTTVKDGVVRGFFHGTGHGVGLDIHEAPSLSTSPAKLETGNVVTVEPGLYDPDIGGIRIEDTVVIERNGARILAGHPKKFEV
jgi:Xaa-Pro aminopeptidase